MVHPDNRPGMGSRSSPPGLRRPPERRAIAHGRSLPFRAILRYRKWGGPLRKRRAWRRRTTDLPSIALHQPTVALRKSISSSRDRWISSVRHRRLNYGTDCGRVESLSEGALGLLSIRIQRLPFALALRISPPVPEEAWEHADDTPKHRSSRTADVGFRARQYLARSPG
jgi:hypothetical protein